MSEQGLTIGFGSALAEQLRWFWRRQWLWIVIVTVLTSAVCAWIIASLPDEARPLIFVVFGSAIHQLLVLIALSWALSAWRDDPPKDRQYFWLHPVERTAHTLARALAGFLWLMLVLVVIVSVVLGTAYALQGADAEFGNAAFWLYVAGAVALAYIAGSIAPILSDRPGLWIVAVIALVIIASTLATVREIDWLKTFLETVFHKGPHSFGAALGAPGQEAARVVTESLGAGQEVQLPGMQRMEDADPAGALLIWLPVSLAALAGAAWASRPR